MSLIHIGEVVDCLNTQKVTLLVPSVGAYNDQGLFIPVGEPTAIPNIDADVQPASGRVLQFVPEGERTREHVSVWFTQLVDTASEFLATQAAQLVYRGFIWKCVSVPEDWIENGFIECLFQNTKEAYTP